MLTDGAALPVLSARLGHSSVRVTDAVYSHAIHGQDDGDVRKWEESQKRNLAATRGGAVNFVRSNRRLVGEVGHHHALDDGEPWNRIRTQIIE